MRFSLVVISVVSVSTAAAAQSLRAQGLDRLSLELAGMYQRFTGNLESQTGPGIGYEGQLRYSSRTWSLGGGIDYVQHERRFVSLPGSQPTIIVRKADANFVGAFLEPRIPLGAENRAVTPYLMLRAGYSRATPRIDTGTGTGADSVEVPVTALTWNGGLGVSIRLAGFASADVAVSTGLTKWRSHDERVLGEQTIGNGSTSTGNVVGRIGLSFGVGR